MKDSREDHVTPDPEVPAADKSPAAVKYVNQLLRDAVKSRASDIHLESTEDRTGRVRLRIDGRLNEIPGPGGELFAHVLRRVMTMAALEAADESMPQDGRTMIKIHEQTVDIRVSAVPTLYGPRVVMRILLREGVILGLDKIGLLDDDLAQLRELCGTPSGIIICTGPTGSGTTTLLYSMLQEINREEVCVMTVEDPVEYSFAGMGQIQIRPQAGLGFERAIRHILRQDPDVIMVGEIRDLGILNACVQCALTGHLVLTTLHANTASGAIKRVMDVGIEPFLVNASITAIVAQRLVRVLCPKCRKPTDPPKHSMPPEAVELLWTLKDAEFFGPVGCEHCHQGYRGRTGINEILMMNDPIRQIVSETADVLAIRDAACQGGMKTMLQNGLEKAARGITSIEDVIRVAPRDVN